MRPHNLSLVALSVTLSLNAAAQALRFDGAVAFPASSPQRSWFGPGGHVGASFDWELVSFLDVQGTVSYSLVPGTSALPAGLSSPASLTFLGAGLRLKRPMTGALVVPWLEGVGGYAGSGSLPRFGACAGTGVSFRLNPSSNVLFGPFARLAYVLSSPEPAFSSHDVVLLAVGVQVELLLGTTAEAGTPVPGPASDTDGDGLTDALDKCPTAPGLPQNGGCPDSDPDQDGLLSSIDKCPTEAGPASNGGCPDDDPDKDGVRGAADRCPNAAGSPSLRGCPDKDGDLVADLDDDCPEKAGTEQNRGCPVYRSVKVTQTKLEINQKIFFAFGKAEILHKSYELLDEVVVALRDHERLCVRIEGHTDSKGSPQQNLKLSADRAAAVRDYLFTHGIEGTRLSSRGYGDAEPLDDNRTTEGREKNRRVEFTIVRCEGSAQ